MSCMSMSVNFTSVNFMPGHFDDPSFSCPPFSAPPVTHPSARRWITTTLSRHLKSDLKNSKRSQQQNEKK